MYIQINSCQTSQTFKIRVIIQNKTNESTYIPKFTDNIHGQDSGQSIKPYETPRSTAKLIRQGHPQNFDINRRAQRNPQGRPPSLIVKRGSCQRVTKKVSANRSRRRLMVRHQAGPSPWKKYKMIENNMHKNE